MSNIIVNPYVFVSGEEVPWTPSQIPTSLWLDAADTDTLTLNGSNVSQWDDKSGNDNDAVQVTETLQPFSGINTLNGLNVIDFANDSFDQVFGITTYKSAIWVMKSIDTSKLVQAIYSDGDTEYTFISTQGSYDISLDGASTNSGNASINGGNLVNGTNIDLGSGAANNQLSNIWYADYGNEIVDVNFIGNINADRLEGSIAELILLPTIPSEIDRQKLEGYLAHKWGLEGKLPAGHPYKSAAPTV